MDYVYSRCIEYASHLPDEGAEGPEDPSAAPPPTVSAGAAGPSSQGDAGAAGKEQGQQQGAGGPTVLIRRLGRAATPGEIRWATGRHVTPLRSSLALPALLAHTHTRACAPFLIRTRTRAHAAGWSYCPWRAAR